MAGNESKKFRDRALKRARRSRLSHEAEDFASFACLKKLEGSSGRIDQLWIDYLRENYGDYRAKHRKEQVRTHTKAIAKMTKLAAHERTGSALEFGFIQRFLCDHGSWFSQRDRAVLTLSYQWGLTNTEIAECFGLDVSRITQIMGEIEGRIRLLFETKEGK